MGSESVCALSSFDEDSMQCVLKDMINAGVDGRNQALGPDAVAACTKKPHVCDTNIVGPTGFTKDYDVEASPQTETNVDHGSRPYWQPISSEPYELRQWEVCGLVVLVFTELAVRWDLEGQQPTDCLGCLCYSSRSVLAESDGLDSVVFPDVVHEAHSAL
ncbi:hypothetical protein LINPERHAP1_LOCUS18761 [Linum perenne]